MTLTSGYQSSLNKRNQELNVTAEFLTTCACVVFLLINVAFYSYFTVSYSSGSLGYESGLFINALNDSDHEMYVSMIRLFEDENYFALFASLTNNVGIAYIYLLLQQVFNYDLAQDTALVSFIVNSLVFLLAFMVFCKIVKLLDLTDKYVFVFFLNPGLIYYSQLINKESFSLLFALLMIYAVAANRIKLVLLLIPLSMIVRLQLGLFGLSLVWLYNRRNYMLSVALLYVITSIGSAVFATQVMPFDEAFLGLGTVQLVYALNESYYIGSLIFNPIRVIQYLYDLSSTIVFVKDGAIDLYALKDAPVAVLMLFLLPFLFYAFCRPNYYQHTAHRILMTSIITFMLVLLMNHLIHARYLFPILPIVFLLGIAVINGAPSNARAERAVPAVFRA